MKARVVLSVCWRSRCSSSLPGFLSRPTTITLRICELADAAIFRSTGVVSGHTLKHLLSAAGVYVLLVMIRRRHGWARAGRPHGRPTA